MALATLALDKCTDDERWLYAAVLCWTASAYAYVAHWPVMPVIVVVQLIIMLRRKTLKLNGNFFAALTLMLVLLAPLFCFLMVNLGLIDEFMWGPFSVPRFSYFRANQVALDSNAMLTQYKQSLNFIVGHSNALPQYAWFGMPPWGMFYRAGFILACAGIIIALASLFGHKQQCLRFDALMLVLLGAGIMQLFLLPSTTPHQNLLCVPGTYFAARACSLPFAKLTSSEGACVPEPRLVEHQAVSATLWGVPLSASLALVAQLIFALVLLRSTAYFGRTYLSDEYALRLEGAYSNSGAQYNSSSFGFDEALHEAQVQLEEYTTHATKGTEKTPPIIAVVNTPHPFVLFYDAYPTPDFVRETREEHSNMYNAYAFAESFSDYVFFTELTQDSFKPDTTLYPVYIVHRYDTEALKAFEGRPYASKTFGAYTVFSL